MKTGCYIKRRCEQRREEKEERRVKYRVWLESMALIKLAVICVGCLLVFVVGMAWAKGKRTRLGFF